MSNKAKNTHLKDGDNQTKQTYSNPGSPLFFSQKQISPSSGTLETKKTQEGKQPTQEISLETTTDILLAAILQELKTQNMIELMKLKAQQEQEQEELETIEKMKEKDDARFNEIRQTMYA
ncbi:hypothetical protein OQJ02_11990 [Legionella sp. PATHC032]|uniref:hypothetical protein n=1 Tax=Legionella sp. PATHC032 TaxID=2992039 RepID=UPI001B2DAD1B|nr:hypothetical protein [Legionella sp. PATHC032]MCW8422350.1 hypothetical protein [Legionella sp. PATHC032]HAZ7574223.1 hypothetical protein [Legionella pneumophila]HBA1635811.1 hypothetical protein [Legionella pneumophila]